MPVSPSEAQGALRDITKAERTSAKAYGYRNASPHLIIWGIVWAIGYGVSYAKPQPFCASSCLDPMATLWPVLIVIGCIASFWIGWKSRSSVATGYDWRYPVSALAIFAFIAAIFAVMPPRDPVQIGAFFPILVALFYTLVGIWTRGARMLIAGIAVAALTLGGYFLLPQYFLLWMAVVGGGALILGGFWLRTV
jgi:hypothetical protein